MMRTFALRVFLPGLVVAIFLPPTAVQAHSTVNTCAKWGGCPSSATCPIRL
jgi:hypothetical protein